MLREEQPPDDAVLIVHLGAGADHNLRDKAIRSFDDYREVTPDASGLFVLSVYAATRGHQVIEIVESLPWNQYGVATAGEVRQSFELLATSIINENGEPLDSLQAVHFDVVLPVPLPSPERLATFEAILNDDELFAQVTEALAEPVAIFRALFEPRVRQGA